MTLTHELEHTLNNRSQIMENFFFLKTKLLIQNGKPITNITLQRIKKRETEEKNREKEET